MRARLKYWKHAAAGLLIAATVGATAHGQVFGPATVIDSFENPTGIANIVSQADPIYVSHAQSALGVTHGANSLELKLTGGGSQFGGDSLVGWAVQDDFTAASNPVGYAAWQTAAANPTYWNLKYDITMLPGAWTGTDFEDGGTHWSFPRVGLSYDGGFAGISVGTNIWNLTGKTTVTVPLTSLTQTGVPIPVDSAFYGLLIGSHNRFQTPASGSVPYYIDRVRLQPAPATGPVTLFSWETPDNPATTTVNEALEGWTDIGLNAASATSLGDAFAHTNSVTTYQVKNAANTANVFPTLGTHSMKIDTTSQDPAYVAPGNTTGLTQTYGFRWGTEYILDTANPVNETAAQVQSKITNLAGKINGADSIQFDVSLSDPVADSDIINGRGIFQGGATATLPGFLSVAMSIQDSRGTFFQYDLPSINADVLQAMILEQNNDGNSPEEPITMTFPIAAFTGRGASAAQYPTITAAPIPLDSTSLRINLALNFNNGPVILHIDNFRVLTPILLDADFNRHGQVNGVDLGVWKAAFNTNGNGDANEDGISDGADVLKWQQQLGNAAAGATPPIGAVPEPAAVTLLAIGSLLAKRRIRQS
jgi:hypothetical protein